MVRVLALAFILLVACTESHLQPKQTAEVSTEPTIEQEMPACTDCDDGNNCTLDSCAGGACVHDQIIPCCGNGICEEGETYHNCDECPVCESGDCQVSGFDYEKGECTIEEVVPCCGNGICEDDETDCLDCPKCEPTDECFEGSIEAGKCVVRPITPCCGNKICDRGESCASCSSDCEYEEGLSLSDFPDFLGDGTLIVVGDSAMSQDSLTATTLTTKLYTEGIETQSNLYSLFDSASLSSKDLIVLGRPCENALWEEYQGIACGTDNYFEPKTALIKLVANQGREIIYVGGHSPDDTKKAAHFLMEGRMSGTEAELDTSGISAKII